MTIDVYFIGSTFTILINSLAPVLCVYISPDLALVNHQIPYASWLHNTTFAICVVSVADTATSEMITIIS